MIKMEKKEYKKPKCEIIELDNLDILAGSPPDYPGPFGAKGRGYDWEEED